MEKLQRMLKVWVFLLVLVCFVSVAFGQQDSYEFLKQKGLEAIEKREAFTVKAVATNNVYYKILKIRFKGDQSGLFIYTYHPDGELWEKGRFVTDDFGTVMDHYQKLKFSISQVPHNAK